MQCKIERKKLQRTFAHKTLGNIFYEIRLLTSEQKLSCGCIAITPAHAAEPKSLAVHVYFDLEICM